ncbi:MAG TPA: Xaa-Pro peptidase family protein [Solirubrobacteraceae bacterium]|nr:Xaa-Pro peptidase family protein [Solirubrobacteraceae bacterium]
MSTRAERLAGRLAEADVDCLLVTGRVDVRYLTGFTGSNGLALIGPQTRVFATDFRYGEQAAEEVDPAYERIVATGSGELLDLVGEALDTGSLRLGFDDRVLTVREHAQLRKQLPDRIELIAAGDVTRGLRAVKDADELERIRAAARVADEALAEVLAQGLIGRTERAVADALEAAMRVRGASEPAFASIVAAGPHGALPHAQPREVPIAAGQLVTIDWGARMAGYCSDCTRTYAAGEPSAHGREIHALVLEAMRAAVATVAPGAEGVAVDAAAREIITAAGHGEHFGHGLGHGAGLEVHEPPALSRRSNDTLRAGEIVTVEPGIYLPGELGVRIEELVRVDEAGPEILTALDTELTVID